MAASAGPALADDDDLDPDVPDGRTPEQVATLQANIDEVIETTAFYAAFSVILLVLITWAIAAREHAWAAYSGLALLILWWLGLFEQNLSGIFWSGFALEQVPLSGAGFVLAALNCLVAARLAEAYPSRLPLPKIMAGLAAAILLICALCLVFLPDLFEPLAFGVLGLSILAHLAPLSKLRVFWRLAAQRRNLVAAFLVLLFWGFLIFGELDEEFDLVFTIRALAGLLTTAFVLVFLVRTVAVLKERDRAIQKSIEDARKEAETSRALWEAEKRYNQAKALAGARLERLASASHDIRQPIAALRTNMAANLSTESPEVHTQMTAAFEYLEQLAGAYMAEGNETSTAAMARDERLNARDVVSTALLGGTVERMFKAAATDKGLSFETSLAEAKVRADPLKLMRVLSNLVANAVAHTSSGHVRIKGATTPEGYAFEVANSAAFPDGIATSDLAAFGKKGESSAGSGIGLAVVYQVAMEEDYGLSMTSAQEAGTRARLVVPLAD